MRTFIADTCITDIEVEVVVIFLEQPDIIEDSFSRCWPPNICLIKDICWSSWSGEHSGAGWAGRSANGEGRVGVMAVIWNNPPRIPSIGGRGARGRGQDAHGAN